MSKAKTAMEEFLKQYENDRKSWNSSTSSSHSTEQTSQTQATKPASGGGTKSRAKTAMDEFLKQYENDRKSWTTTATTQPKTSYLDSARNAAQASISTGTGTLSDIDRESRRKELQAELDDLNSQASLNRKKMVGYQRGNVSNLLKEAERESVEIANRISEVNKQLEWLDKPESISYSDQLSDELAAAQERQRQAQSAVSKYSGSAGGRALAALSAEEREALYQDLNDANGAVAALSREQDQIDYLNEYQDKVYDDNFTGQFGANYRQGRIAQDANAAFAEYIANPTEANRNYAFALQELEEQFRTNNQSALEDEGAVLPWVTQSAAGYIPQLWDQTKTTVAGGLVGGLVGATVGQPIKGAGVGVTLARGEQSYNQMKGAAYRALIAEGMDEESALEAAQDEAFISALIEMADTGTTLLSLGFGKAANILGNAAIKSGSKNAAVKWIGNAFGKGAANKAAKEAAEWAGKTGVQKALSVGTGIALNAGQEYAEEWMQEMVSSANKERESTGKWDLVKETAGLSKDALTGKNPDALAQAHEAGTEGFKIGLMFGGTMGAFNAAVSTWANAKTTAQQEQVVDEIMQDRELVESLIDGSMEMGAGTVSEKMAIEMRDKLAANESVTRQDVAQLLAANEAYVQAGGLDNVDQAIEQAAREAVGLETSDASASQDVVDVLEQGDSKYTPEEAPLTAPQNAPYNVMATNNPERQARMSLEKSTGYGEHGAKTFVDIVESSNANPDQVRMEFQRAYEAGLTNLPRAKVDLISNVQEMAFNAGRMDYIMDMDKAKSAAPSVRSDAGFDRTNLPADVTEAQYRAVDALAKATGVKVKMAKGLKGNAEIASDGTVLIDETFQRKVKGKQRSIVFYAAHEIGMHRLMQLAPEDGRAFINAVVQDANAGLAYGQTTVTEKRQAAYARQNVNLTTSKAMEEVAADSILDLYDSEEDFIAAINRIINGKDEQAKRGARKFKDILDDIVKKLKNVIAKLTGKEKAEAQQTLSEVEKLRDLYERALQSATDKVKTGKSANNTGRAETDRGTISHHLKEVGVYAQEGRTENRRAFLERSNRSARKSGEVGEIAYSYVPVGEGDTSYAAEEIAKELSALGVRSFYHDGLEYNVGGKTYTDNGYAAAIADVAVAILRNAYGDGKDIAGHEAYHIWGTTDSRERYTAVLRKNIDILTPYALEQADIVANGYFEGTAINKTDFVEEYYARLSGQIHSGKHDADLITMFKDYGAVKTAWNELVKQNSGRQHSLKEDGVQMEQDLNDLRRRRAELQDEIDGAYLDDLPQADIRKLENRMYKLEADIDKLVAQERRAAVRTSMNDILSNLSAYRRSDLESLAEQISDGNWDDYEDLSRTELEEALREAIESRELNAIEMQSTKYGLYVRPVSGEQFSLKDSDGRELSEGQREYFKDSKERDSQGNLRVMYQGGKGGFTVFDRKKSSYSNHYGRGFYFTNSESHAKQYGEARAFYLNIKNPVSTEETTITKAQLRKFLKAVAENEDDYSFENYGYGATVESVLQSIYGKSDFAMLYDVDQTAIGNMVETVELFNSINDTDYDGLILDTESVTFRSNQAKNVDNLKPTEDEDTRFSLKSPVEETKNLVALHNMTEKNLRGVLRLGGFPMPSLAIVKADAGHSKYGPISVVFGKDTIDPQASSLNKVYGGDAYTPTDPGVYYPMDRDIERDFDSMVWKASQAFAGGEFKQSSPLGSLGYNGETRDDMDEIASRLARHEAVQAAYLSEQGKTLEPVMREKVSDVDPFGNEALQRYIDRLSVDELINKWYDYAGDGGLIDFMDPLGDEDVALVREVMKDHWRVQPRFGKPYPEEMLERRAQKIDEYRAAKFVKNAWNFWATGGNTAEETDYSATKKAMQEMIVPGGNPEEVEAVVRDWAKSKLEGLLGEPGVYNGKSAFTPSGNRRKFWARHDPYTLENIVKAMKANQQERGGQTFGISAGSLQATATPSYKSIAQIKADSGRLGAVSGEEYEARKQAVEGQIDKVIEAVKAGTKSVYGADRDVIGDILKEAAAGKKTVDAIVRKFKAEGYSISTKTAQDIQAVYRAAAELPTEYFEAKPQRAVGFDEVLAVVVPDNLDAQLKEQMRNAGMKVLEFKAGDDADRLAVVNSVDGAQFSLKEHNDLMRENARLKEVNESLRDQFKTTEFAKVDRKSLDGFTKRLLKDYSSGADINETRDALDGLYTYLANGEDGMSPSWNEAYKRAYETAASILEASSALDDDMYRQYKDLRERLRNARISIAPEYGNDLMGYENLQDFRKRNMGRLNITKDGSPVDVVYSELAATYPELFDETEYTNQGDQLVHIADVLESMRPMEVNPYSYNMRESATWLANDIMERFFDLPQAKPTFADKAQRKLTNQAIKDAKKLERVREQKNERIKQLIEDNREKVKQVQSKERDKRLKAVQEVKEHYKAKEGKASESRKARDLRARVVRHAEQMSKKLLRGTDKNNVPEGLRGAVAELLAAINLESNYTYDPVTGGYRKSDDGLPTRRTEEFRKVREQYEAIAKNNEYGMVLDPNLLGVPTEGIPSMLDQVIAMKDIRLADMNLSQLQVVYDVLRVMEHSIQMAGKMLTRTRWESIHAAAENFMEDTATRRTKRALTKDHKMLDIETPYTFFSHFGNAGKDFFRMLRNAQDEEETMQDQLRDRLAESVSLEDRQAAEKETVTYTTQRGDDLTLSKAHIMNIYLLNKRKQAQQHLLSGGIVQPEIGKVRKGTDAVLLNELDVANIISKLSDKEREMADALQKLTLLMAEWGNKASMTVYGIKKFNDPDYWTIHSSDIGINQTVEQGQNKARSIANMGSAKAVIPEARNTLDIDSAFEVFDRHASDMMCYSAWLAPMEDANRLFNYKYRDADWNPTGKTMKGIIDRVSGEGSTKYWLRLMEDIQNGLSAPADTASEQGVMKAIGNVKKAAVSANLRVVIQQPTAYARAAVVLDPDIMLAALGKNAALKPAVDGWNKAVKYAPIAARKAAGGYEVAANPKQLAELLYQPKSKKGKVAKGWREAPLWLAGKMDQYTWGTIWNACEMQVARDNKALKKDSDAFNDAVKELFTDVIDQTQVVDGVLQRSQAMRSGSNFMKQMTSFTGEPTQGANMVIRAYDQLRYEQNPKKRGRAIKTLSRAVSAYMFVSVLNAFAQSLIDGLRDDDEDKEYWERVWTAFHGVNGNEETWWDFARNILLASNVVNNMNPATWLPVWKDVLSVIQGYSVERMDAASLSDFFDSLTNVVKSVEGDGKYTPGYAALKSLTLGHKLLGGSSYNTLRDIESIVRTVQVETDNYLARYETMKLMTKPENNLSEYVGLLFKAYQNDQQAYKTMYDDLVASGVDPEKIRSKMESLLKKAQGVDSVDDLEQRYLSPTQQKEYSSTLSSIKSSSVWKKASADQRDDAEGMLYDLTVQNTAGEKLQEKIDGGAPYGLDETEYLLYKLALDVCDQPSESGKLGSYTNDEVEAAIRMLGLSAKESAYLWDAQGKSEKSNPWRK